MICCLIWLLSYEGAISNPFQVWRNTVAGTAVVLVLADIKQSSGDSGCTLRKIVLFQRSLLNKHPMPLNPFEIAVVLFSQSSAMIGVIQFSFEQHLKFFSLPAPDDLHMLLMMSASGDQLLRRVLLMTSASGPLIFRTSFISDASSFLLVDSIALICSIRTYA